MATIDQVQPQKLYRYRSLGSLKKFKRELETLVEGYIYCAAYDTLNDPMEGVFRSSRVFRDSDNYRDTRRAIVENKTQIGMSSLARCMTTNSCGLIMRTSIEEFASLIVLQNCLIISLMT
jgi:hypothetical protein